jgi:Xaa-Pro aminopeptidase
MNVSERIQALRSLMQEAGWDAVVISGTDPHGSEYLPERWQQRKWISGFTGSYGTVVVTHKHA